MRSRQNGAAETGHWHAGLVCQKRAIGGGSGRRLVSPPHSAKREPGRRKSMQKKGILSLPSDLHKRELHCNA